MKVPTTNITKEHVIKACNRAINKIDHCNFGAHYSVYYNMADNIAWIYAAAYSDQCIRGDDLYCIAGPVSPYRSQLRGLAHLKRVLKSAVVDRADELQEDGIID